MSNWPTTSRHSRGYGSRWDKLRITILERDKYLCQCDECKATKRIREARHVNHITSKAEAARLNWTQAQIDDPSNLQAVNADCHDRITKLQQGHTPKPKPPRIGLDGFPITERS